MIVDDPMDEDFCDAPPPTFGGVLLVVATATPSLSQQPSGWLLESAPLPSLLPPFATTPTWWPVSLEVCITPTLLLEEDGDDASFCTLPPPKSLPPLRPPPYAPRPPQKTSTLSRVPVPACCRDTLCPTLGEIEQHCPLSATPQTIITRTTTAANTIKTTTFPTASAEPLQTPCQLPPLLSTTVTTTATVTATITTTAKGQFKDCIRTGSPTLDGPVSLLDSRSIESRLMDTLPPPLPLSPPSGLDLNSSPSFSSSSSSGFFTDLAMDEILFADIDTSMYDFDTCTTPATPSVMPSQPFNMDLTELDHIMEVLVGS
ncbi:SERTA domain-containing protein 2-like [Oncorhynchus mykiss]|uniref:SERTA domain-containing protein 2-like n=1 Tax=Oncorhynchus mykiss TaxID=8022 RepID=UPI001878A988|nr:SERTA domain-containing protein 2-like [Oncorhynchus mykiss]